MVPKTQGPVSGSHPRVTKARAWLAKQQLLDPQAAPRTCFLLIRPLSAPWLDNRPGILRLHPPSVLFKVEAHRGHRHLSQSGQKNPGLPDLDPSLNLKQRKQMSSWKTFNRPPRPRVGTNPPTSRRAVPEPRGQEAQVFAVRAPPAGPVPRQLLPAPAPFPGQRLPAAPERSAPPPRPLLLARKPSPLPNLAQRQNGAAWPTQPNLTNLMIKRGGRSRTWLSSRFWSLVSIVLYLCAYFILC